MIGLEGTEMLIAMGLYIVALLLPFFMAQSRNRSGILWLIASIFITTPGAIVLLLILGTAGEPE